MGLGVESAKTLTKILNKSKDISELICSRNSIGDQGIKALLPFLIKSQSLVHLDLTSNEIGHEGGSLLFEALSLN